MKIGKKFNFFFQSMVRQYSGQYWALVMLKPQFESGSNLHHSLADKMIKGPDMMKCVHWGVQREYIGEYLFLWASSSIGRAGKTSILLVLTNTKTAKFIIILKQDFLIPVLLVRVQPSPFFAPVAQLVVAPAF